MRYLITLLGITASWIFPEAMAKSEVIVFLLVVGTIGMAHGSLDHLVHQAAPGKQTTSMLRFYGLYLFAVALVSLVWWWDPMAGLAIFAASSAYHFGQAEVRSLAGKNRLTLWSRRFAWGLALLALPLILHTSAMVTTFSEWDTTIDVQVLGHVGRLVLIGSGLLFIGATIASALFSETSISQTLHQKETWLPVGAWGLYAGMLLVTPPLWGFTLYFGLWHAWPALNKVADELFLRNVKDWWHALLPNYVPSLIATLAWVFIAWRWAPEYLLVGLLVLLSALTVPHMLVFERLYQKRLPALRTKFSPWLGEPRSGSRQNLPGTPLLAPTHER